MILRIIEVRVCGPHSLRLTFNDGTTKQVNVRPLLDGAISRRSRTPPISRPWHWIRFAARSSGQTVRIFAPEALHELEAETMLSEPAA